MKTNTQFGYDFAKGAVLLIIQTFAVLFLTSIAITFAFQLLGFGIDNSDLSTWHRSGLRILTDAKTGIEYLSDGNGGLIRRGSREDQP